MRLLLDTHIFLWLATDSRKASKKLRTQIETASDVYVSTASVWEVAIKSALGKLDGDPESFHRAVARLSPLHKDPFDRLLIAQAMTEPLLLLTADATLGGYSDLVRVV